MVHGPYGIQDHEIRPVVMYFNPAEIIRNVGMIR